MKKASDLLDGAVSPAISRFLGLVRVWRAAAGDRIADISTPVRIDKGKLSVLVHNELWVSELGFFKEELLEKLRAGGLQVDDIRFQFRARLMDKPSTDAKKRTPSPEEMRFVNNLARSITDPELQASFAKAMSAYFTRYTLDDFFSIED